MKLDDETEPAALHKSTLLHAARRFGVPGRHRMTKDELIDALGYTAWTPAAEVPHFYLDEHHPQRGQPIGTCALCFRTHDKHGAPQPGRSGWPHEWRWKLGEPFPEICTDTHTRRT
jgi:hypothetical protein